MAESVAELSKSVEKIKVDIGILSAAVPNVTGLAVDVSTLKAKLDKIDKDLSRPLFKDMRFWAGVAAIPLLILGGWGIDKTLTGGKPLALSLIHQAMGTQPVVINALATRGDPVYGAMQATLQAMLDGNETLDNAIGKVVDEKLQIVGSGLLQLGFVRPDMFKVLPCDQYFATKEEFERSGFAPNDPCEDRRAATLSSSTGVFGLRGEGNVKIVLGVNAAELIQKLPRSYQGAEVKEFTATALKDLLDVQLDDVPLEVGKVDSWIESRIGNQVMRMAYLRLEGKPLDRSLDFPLHTLTVSLRDPAPPNLLVSVAYVINADPKEPGS